MDYNDSAKDLTLEEWFSKPRKFCKKSRVITMQEYINQVAPLPFMEEKVIGHINKISKQDKRKQDEELQEAEKILIRRQLEEIARRLNKGQKIDWNNDSQAKYRIELYCDEIKTNYYFTYKTQGAVYCLDKNFLNTAIKEIGEERLINYLRDE